MEAREVEIRVQRAAALAREQGCRPAGCRICGGWGRVTVEDPGSPTGRRTFDPCFECLGTGSMWVDAADTSEWVRRLSGGLLNFEEVIQRFEVESDQHDQPCLPRRLLRDVDDR
jgi:hypothetical protein